MTSKLRDLIRSVRTCKTAAEERAIITKESALIRTAFKDDSHSEYRHRNVAKLLYFSILGYPTHFGQMECIKLLASSRFNEKRIGYLALMMLLDEKAEVLTLVTNSLQMDLNHANQFVAGLALTALGTIGSAEMARDLARDVDKHLKSTNPYLRKKAALCTIRLLKRVPDLIDTFLPHIVVLLTDKNHNVLLAAVTLVTAVVQIEPGYTEKFGRLVPALIKILRKLLMAGYAPEYDIGGVTDPFLQARILHLLRILGRGNAAASEAMGAVLAQVTTNTEASRNSGSAVLYEAVNTILAVDSEAGLRVLAVNHLGKFLSSRDPNQKYVALDTLTRVISYDVAAVQRHRAVIVECLRDADVSIRRRALDLVYALVNAENVRPLTKELLNYLSVADAETKPDLCVKVAAVADKFAPSRRWHIDTLVSLLGASADTAKRPVLSMTLFLITHTPDEHAALTHKLFSLAATALASSGTAENSQQLLQVAVWCIGEYCNLLLAPAPAPAEDSVGPVGEQRTEMEVVRVLDKVLHSFGADMETKAMVLTALLKLVVKLGGAATAASAGSAASPHAHAAGSADAALARARRILASYEGSQELELQARAVEYSAIADPFGRLRDTDAGAGAGAAGAAAATGGALLDGSPAASPSTGGASAAAGVVATHRAELVAPIPLLEEAILRARAAPAGIVATAPGDSAMGDAEAMSVQARTRPKAPGAAAPSTGAGASAAAGGAAAGAGAAAGGAASTVDLLGDLNDLLGGIAAPAPAAAAGGGAKAGAPAASKALDLDALFSTVATTAGNADLLGGAAPGVFSPVMAPGGGVATTPASVASASSAAGGGVAGGGARPAAAPAPVSGMAALDDLFGGPATAAVAVAAAPLPAPGSLAAGGAFPLGSGAAAGGASVMGNGVAGGGAKSTGDALGDLFASSLSGLGAAPAPAPAPAAPLRPLGAATAAPSLDALFSAGSGASSAVGGGGFGVGAAGGGGALPLVLPHSFTAYDGPHVTATFRCDKPLGAASTVTDVAATFRAKPGVGVTGFVCQVAPPKYVKLTLLPASGAAFGGAGAPSEVTQTIKLDNSQHGAKPLMLKLKIVYTLAGTGEQVTEVHDVKSFPAAL